VPRRSKHPLSTGHTCREPLLLSDQVNGANRGQDQCTENGLAIVMKHQTACGQKEGNMGTLDCCNDHEIYGKMPINETVKLCDINLFVSRLP
jgi:hypothetical protein